MSVSLFFVALGVWLFFGPRIVIGVLVYMFFGYLFCDINTAETYSWYSGIWHGMFFIPNLLRHCFNSDILYKANDYTAAYNIWWWISTVVSVISFIFGGRRQEY